MEINCSSLKENSDKIKDFPSKETLNKKNTMRKEKGDVISKSNKAKVTGSSSLTHKKSELDELCEKVSQKDLNKLCEQILSFNERIKASRGLLKIRYDIPQHLQDKLNDEALELECLYKELVSASKNIETIRCQREAVAKERLDLEEQITRLKADALSELEVIVSVYDVRMLERWHEVKSTDSQSQVENFLHDVKGKLEAMKNLQTLATQKLAKMTDEAKEESSKKDKKKKNCKERRRGQSNSMSNYFEQREAENQPIPLPLPLLDSDPEGLLEDGNTRDVLYNLVYGEILNFPVWAQESYDAIDVD